MKPRIYQGSESREPSGLDQGTQSLSQQSWGPWIHRPSRDRTGTISQAKRNFVSRKAGPLKGAGAELFDGRDIDKKKAVAFASKPILPPSLWDEAEVRVILVSVSYPLVKLHTFTLLRIVPYMKN